MFEIDPDIKKAMDALPPLSPPQVIFCRSEDYKKILQETGAFNDNGEITIGNLKIYQWRPRNPRKKCPIPKGQWWLVDTSKIKTPSLWGVLSTVREIRGGTGRPRYLWRG